MTALVLSKHKHSHQIALVRHPEAAGVVESAHLGNIRTEVGPAAYQLATGEIIEI